MLVGVFIEVGAATEYTPHLISRVPTKADLRRDGGTGRVVARISALYEVDTGDWVAMRARSSERLAAGLENIAPAYLELSHVEAYLVGSRCVPGSLRCTGSGGAGIALRAPGIGGMGADGSLGNADPRHCEVAATSAYEVTPHFVPVEFTPKWSSDEDLKRKTYRTPFCVSTRNTSLYQSYYSNLKHVYVTGWRDDDNSYLTSNPALGIKFEIHVVGRIPVEWAKFLNVKFILNGSIPMPLYQPEIVDRETTLTDDLNITVPVLGLRQIQGDDVEALVTALPVCVEPRIPLKGCFRLEHMLYDHPRLSEYKLKTYLIWRKHLFMKIGSDPPHPNGDFNVSQGPWPVFDWLDPPKRSLGSWQQWTFPQKEHVYQEDCRYPATCDEIPLAPSPRHLHSATLYTTWNFKQHAWKYLCNENPECGTDCLTNLTCLGGLNYFDQNFYFRSGEFRNDDKGIVPFLGLKELDCPRLCCRDRRFCMRKYDVLGYEVPFDAQVMLVFGGKTYVHEKDPRDGRLIYHSCEQIPKLELKDGWRSCKELVVADLWRYDISRSKWEYIKADSAISPTTLQPVGYPVARFGHGAVTIEEVDTKDPSSKRIFMYIYGGMGPLCEGGVCSDVWRYEVPWAAQAYYPKFPDGDWNRGNFWDRLKDCPFGGLYRHGMVATSGMEYIYVYGGQVLGGFRHELYRYRVSTDTWENLDPFGRLSLTRLMYDFSGAPRIRQVPTSEYDERIDVDCKRAWRFDGRWRHCIDCPACGLQTGTRREGADMPTARGDFAMTTFEYSEGTDDAMVILGGYRTTWGALRVSECEATTTTTWWPMLSGDGLVLTTPPPWTIPTPTTTYLDKSGMLVVGTFPNSPTSAATDAGIPTTTVGGRRLQTPTESLGGPDVLSKCDAKYYFDDLWIFDAGRNQWVRHHTSGAVPMARRGHCIIARRAQTNDTQLFLFGGHNQDLPMNDIWILDLMRNIDDRSWTRIDNFIKGRSPPPLSYHTMVYSEVLNLVVVFGGLHWKQTNLTESDHARNVDRRCFKRAQGLPQNERDTEETALFNKMGNLCVEEGFCCILTLQDEFPDSIGGTIIRNASGGMDLIAISTICRKDCEGKAFHPEFSPIMVEGVWEFRTDICPQNCSGHGHCDLSFCVCEPSWYGSDCSMPRCPGSTCYTHPKTTEQFCVECSQHGRCINGECMCFPGWGYEDCSAALCEANCSSTPTETRGVCVEDFPVHQCHCFGHWSGSSCNELLCLNSCGLHGRCVSGVCECDPGYYGEDCSLFFVSL